MEGSLHAFGNVPPNPPATPHHSVLAVSAGGGVESALATVAPKISISPIQMLVDGAGGYVIYLPILIENILSTPFQNTKIRNMLHMPLRI